MQNYFHSTPDSPYQVSVAAILINESNQVFCHYFEEIKGFKDFYHVMSESLELYETLEEALHRGLMEEFGAEGEILTFLGGINSEFDEDGYHKTKTTLYFLARCLDQDNAKRKKPGEEGGEESSSILKWCDIDFLIKITPVQAKRINRQDLDHSEALIRTKSFLSK